MSIWSHTWLSLSKWACGAAFHRFFGKRKRSISDRYLQPCTDAQKITMTTARITATKFAPHVFPLKLECKPIIFSWRNTRLIDCMWKLWWKHITLLRVPSNCPSTTTQDIHSLFVCHSCYWCSLPDVLWSEQAWLAVKCLGVAHSNQVSRRKERQRATR